MIGVQHQTSSQKSCGRFQCFFFNRISRWWQLKDFVMFTRILAEDSHLTHIFQLGWFNHQLPASSKWSFDHPNGGHLAPEKVTLNTQKGHWEEPGRFSLIIKCMSLEMKILQPSWHLLRSQHLPQRNFLTKKAALRIGIFYPIKKDWRNMLALYNVDPGLINPMVV